MSPLERPVPPTGEEIHIPASSAQPVLLAIGITLGLVGVTLGPLVWIPGVVLTLWVCIAWIRDAVREYRSLPSEHAPVVQETVPRREDRPHPASAEDSAANA